MLSRLQCNELKIMIVLHIPEVYISSFPFVGECYEEQAAL